MSANNLAWLMLVVSLPGRSPTPRMRLWRALKAAGAAMLRDGVYVLPAGENARALFQTQANEVTRIDGSAQVVPFASTGPKQESELRTAFDRTEAYAQGLERLAALRTEIRKLAEIEARRRLAASRRELEAIAAIDFFPGAARKQVETALTDAEHALSMQFSPDEPHAKKAIIPRRRAQDYRNRVWATRRHLWIDRVASAWLIHRFIDPRAEFRWLKKPADCPKRAVGFDFNGAEFSHVGARVTFEALAASFGLDRDPRLARMGRLIRYLDIGGVPVPDAAGFASIMAGARARHGEDDDALLRDMSIVLDCLYAAYPETQEASS
ncbi:MAG TPA: chromate resistance protein ChrB domain-containing protein [Rhodanobacteraceae bacterium]|nr:chromate resistance protein ChrB domain-containing protein [Rhodanobacteraceae bacterium]